MLQLTITTLALTLNPHQGSSCSASCCSHHAPESQNAPAKDPHTSARDLLFQINGLCRYPTYNGPPMSPPSPARGASESRSIQALNSNPGAPVSVYLDFNGHTEDSTIWAIDYGYGVINHQGLNLEGSPDTYSATEQAFIQEVFERVAEDYAPFNVNITTVEPAGLNGPGVALRVVFTDYDWFGAAGGVAPYLGNFTDQDGASVFTFINGTGNGWAKGAAEATSHEIGHAFNLAHQSTYDGTTKLEEYNPGGNGWAPIMGNGYNQDLVTFHDGPNSFSSISFQRDLSVMRASPIFLPLRADDHANFPSNATAPDDQRTGSFTVTGIIETNTDRDVFTISHAGGPLSFSVQSSSVSPNLDASLRLLGPGTNIIESPSDSLAATINTTLPAAEYILAVSSNGDYGRIGTYNLTGTYNPQPLLCEADTDNNNTINIEDLLYTLRNFGSADENADFNDNGEVDIEDLLTVLRNFGFNC